MRFYYSNPLYGIRQFDQPVSSVVLGRQPEPRDPQIELDLGPDRAVSGRPHARLSYENGAYWIEDMGSTNGTFVNGQKIAARTWLQPHDLVFVGQTKIEFEPAEVIDGGHIKETLISTEPPIKLLLPADQTVFDATRRRLNVLYELSAELGTCKDSKTLGRIAVEYLRRAIPTGNRWGLFLLEGSRPLLKAYLATDNNPEHKYSLSLAQWAIANGKAYHWQGGQPHPDGEVTNSLTDRERQSAIYAPLCWQGETLGVLFTETDIPGTVFDEDELRLVAVIASQTAMFVKNNTLQQKSGRDSAILEELLRPFPPKVAEYLIKQGRLQLGGEWTDQATILFSDVRGFTAFSSQQNPNDILQLINDMFHDLVPIISKKYDGTVDKYVGDAILAVFGSPQPDENQCEKAVRAALEMQKAMERLAERWQSRNMPVLEIGIGIHTGEVVHGFVGAHEHKQYTVIGDTVNKASRYCDGAGRGEVLISPAVYQQVDRRVSVKRELKILKSKHPDTEPDLEAYPVIGLR